MDVGVGEYTLTLTVTDSGGLESAPAEELTIGVYPAPQCELELDDVSFGAVDFGTVPPTVSVSPT